MSSLNLGPISQVVEQYMLDEVTVNRYAEPTVDGTTLAMTRTATEIYNGQGFIVPIGNPYRTALGGEQLAESQYEIAIPNSADPVLPNDEVTCNDSKYNPDMIGAVFIVTGEIVSTFTTHKRLACYKKQDAS